MTKRVTISYFFFSKEVSWLKEAWFDVKSRLAYYYSGPAKYSHWGYYFYYEGKHWCYLLRLHEEPWGVFWERKVNQMKLAVLIFLIGFYAFSVGTGVYSISKELIITTTPLLKQLAAI